MEREKLILEDNIRHTFMSVVWTHKIQEKQADILNEKFNKYEVIRIICASFTSVGLISLIFVDEFWIKVISAVLSFINTSISMFFKSFDIQKNISNHKRTAIDLLVLRDKLRLLLTEVHMDNAVAIELIKKYEDLQDQVNQVYKDAPNTTDKAVNRAFKALKIKKDNEFSDDEIDCNLPKSLQRKELEKYES